MAHRYSRRARTEEKRNPILLSAAFIFYGLPAVAKFAALLMDLRTSTAPVEVSDNTPPPPPRLDPIPSFTNELSVEISGTTEPGVSVILFLNSKEKEVLADNQGEFSHTFMLNKGENTFSSLARDSSGNESQETEIQTITHDNEPPELVVTKPDDGTSYYGARERQVVIEGSTEEDVSININGRQVVVEADGSFAFATTLSEGGNDFTIKAEDQAGNTTELSLAVSFTP
jgi:hypothetical protein